MDLTAKHTLAAAEAVDRLTDAEALARVIVIEALAISPKATWRVRTVARRLHALYTAHRAEGMGHAAAFAAAWHLTHGFAQQMGVS